MSNPRFYAWFITINQPHELMAVVEELSTLKTSYLCAVHEAEGGEEEHRPHSHIVVKFNSQRKFTSLKKWFNDRELDPHLEGKTGNALHAAIDYIKKKPYPIMEIGNRPKSRKEIGQEESNRWKRIREAAENGKLEEIEDKVRFIYHKTLKQIRQDYISQKVSDLEENFNFKSHFFWLWGPTGTGKSHNARKLAGTVSSDPPYIKDTTNKWWDNYMGQKVVIMEDLAHIPLELQQKMKVWCDRYAFTGEVKGSTILLRPEYIIVTSNYQISEVFESERDQEAMHRRFNEFHVATKFIPDDQGYPTDLNSAFLVLQEAAILDEPMTEELAVLSDIEAPLPKRKAFIIDD